MKYCFILFLFLMTACTQTEDFKTTKAEKWNLLEDVFLFEDKESIKTYENIEKVYDTVVVVKTNPVSGKPVVFPVSERKLKTLNR